MLEMADPADRVTEHRARSFQVHCARLPPPSKFPSLDSLLSERMYMTRQPRLRRTERLEDRPQDHVRSRRSAITLISF
jgi:hypothetical protein